MKALVYEGPRQVTVKEMPDAQIEKPTDVLVKITTTNICGSDLHMYEGRTDMETGRILGHENMGQVVEVGAAVDRVKKGDWVVLPFNIGCGFCTNCEKGLTGYCLTCNPGSAGAAYGFADMGPYSGGQAEYLRVPYGDFNCLVLPPDAKSRQKDYVMLSDIFPTGWHATRLAGLMPGESIVIYGAGPVGLMAAHSALIQGAAKVYIVDRHPDRLKLAESIGAITIDDSKVSPVDFLMKETSDLGVDRGCECVGYQAHDAEGDEQPDMTMNSLIGSVKATGGIGVVGVFVPEDPQAEDPLQKKGKLALDFGKLWFKGQTVRTGQCNVKHYNRELCNLIHNERANPSFIVSHELDLDKAPEAYERFDKREKGGTKVILHPGN